MSEPATLFRFDGASLGYAGKPVLEALTLKVRRGDKIALLGESGTGKSTLLRRLRELRPSDVAWCPQQPGLVPVLSAFHNIYMGRLERHPFWYNLANLVRPLATPKAEIAGLASRLGLSGQLWRPAGALSGGQQSRVSLARALYQQKPVFIGDEPVSALDERQAAELLQLVCARHQTVVLALHNVEQALTHCSRIVGLRQGRLVLDAPSSELSAAQLRALYTSL
ncbi:ATP-binding cassette domain-containing protein [Oceanimonas doudoroffii]|uniref:Phosphonate ABC transporter ATP-binding protein n=1 Tax=Oceanimonas doudoroffii TaxID=84158 RepID=A0A233RB68_9GAMM|nr:ATP-binding cassette domain-containing protein [Oceanimonas doudoroffii]OXY80636.1 phosphonate ABC transporter ATP-binding protein [Oceanimonas doudoroffii]